MSQSFFLTHFSTWSLLAEYPRNISIFVCTHAKTWKHQKFKMCVCTKMYCISISMCMFTKLLKTFSIQLTLTFCHSIFVDYFVRHNFLSVKCHWENYFIYFRINFLSLTLFFWYTTHNKYNMCTTRIDLNFVLYYNF